MDTVHQRVDVVFAQPCGLDRVVNIDGDFGREEFPIAFFAELECADDAHRRDRISELDRHSAEAGIEWANATIAGARAFGEDDQADAIIQSLAGELHHLFVLRQIAFGRHRDVAEPSHHPAVSRDLEMRFVFKAAHELWDRRVDDERVPYINVVADEEAGTLSVEAWGIPRLEIDSRDAQHIAKEPSLRPVVLARVDERAEQD